MDFFLPQVCVKNTTWAIDILLCEWINDMLSLRTTEKRNNGPIIHTILQEQS